MRESGIRERALGYMEQLGMDSMAAAAYRCGIVMQTIWGGVTFLKPGQLGQVQKIKEEFPAAHVWHVVYAGQALGDGTYLQTESYPMVWESGRETLVYHDGAGFPAGAFVSNINAPAYSKYGQVCAAQHGRGLMRTA